MHHRRSLCKCLAMPPVAAVGLAGATTLLYRCWYNKKGTEGTRDRGQGKLGKSWDVNALLPFQRGREEHGSQVTGP